jgi:hypothetical protein
VPWALGAVSAAFIRISANRGALSLGRAYSQSN